MRNLQRTHFMNIRIKQAIKHSVPKDSFCDWNCRVCLKTKTTKQPFTGACFAYLKLHLDNLNIHLPHLPQDYEYKHHKMFLGIH